MTQRHPARTIQPAPWPRRANTPHPGGKAPSPAAQGFRLRTLAWMVAAAFVGLPATTAWAQPAGAQAIAGQASLQQQGNRLVVTTQNAPGTSHSAINWQSFNVPAGSTTWFDQPGAGSTSINRVVAANPSSILGTLGSNGHIVLVNPNGIAVGAGAVVDTARFTAAAMQMSDADALAGRLRFEGGSSVQVQGQVLARGSDVLMLAPDVQVAPGALVQAPNGAVLLAAGHKVEVLAPGLDGLRFEIQAPTDQAVNLGQLQGNAVGMFASTLRHSGQMNVEAVQADGGKIVIRAKDQATIDGSARAQRLDRLGGLFQATAQTLNVGSTARIDASGANGGGEVLLGGGWQGKDARVTNAQTTTVARGAQIDASATEHGQGGTVVAWADGSTTFQGQITARGGAQGGNGGQVETSGKQHLTLGGKVDTRAPQGQTGTWLLDPTNLTIAGGAAPTTGPASDTVYESDLELSASNIHLQAQESIGVAGTFSDNAIRVAGLNVKLETVSSTGGAGINMVVAGTKPQAIAIETGGKGTIELRTLGSGQNIITGDLATSGGNITVQAAGQLNLGHVVLESNGGSITLQGGGLGQTSGSGVYIHSNSRVDAGTGTVSITGQSTAQSGVDIQDALTLSGTSSSIKGSSNTGSGVAIASGTDISGSGALSIKGEVIKTEVTGTGSGVRIGTASIQDRKADITIVGSTSGVGGGVSIGKASIANKGNVSIAGMGSTGNVSIGAGAVVVAGIGDTGDLMVTSEQGSIQIGSSSRTAPRTSLSTGGGVVLINAAKHGVLVHKTDIASNGGSIMVQGASSPASSLYYGVEMLDASLDTGGSTGTTHVSGQSDHGSGLRIAGTLTLKGDAELSGVSGSSGSDGVVMDGSVISGSGALGITGQVTGSGSGHGIQIYGATIQDRNAPITLTGSTTGSGSGVLIAQGYGTDFAITNSGSLTIEGSAVSGTGVHIFNATARTSKLAANGVTIQGQSTSSAGVKIENGDIQSTGGDITVSAATGSIDISNTLLKNGGTGLLKMSAPSGAVAVSASTLSTTSGNVLIEGGTSPQGSATAAGVGISDSSVTSTGGTVDIKGKSATGMGDGLSLSGNTISGTSVKLSGETASDGASGVYLSGYGLGGSGELTVIGSHTGTGSSNGAGILLDAPVQNRNAAITLTGTATGNGSGTAIVTGATITNSGALRIQGSSALGEGVVIGDVAAGSATAVPTVSLTANGIDIQGESPMAGNFGVRIEQSSLTSTDGALKVKSDGDAIRIANSSLGNTGSGTLEITAPSRSVELTDASLATNVGSILVAGGTSAYGVPSNVDNTSSGVAMTGGSVTSAKGNVQISGSGENGVLLAGKIALSGSSVQVWGQSSESDRTGVLLDGYTTPTSLTGSGDLAIIGTHTGVGMGIALADASIVRAGNISLIGRRANASGNGNAGVMLVGNQTHIDAGTAKVSITGHSGTGPGVKISGDLPPAPGPMPSVTGGDVSIVGNTSGSTGLHLERAQIKASDKLRLETSEGDMLIQSSELSSTGKLGTMLYAGGTGSAITLDSGSSIQSSQASTPITLIADRMQLDGLVKVGTQAAVVIRPRTASRGITLGGSDETGQLNLTQSELNNIRSQIVQMGWGGASGGIQVLGPVSLGTSAAPVTLSLTNKGSITQGTGGTLQVARLELSGGSVDLRQNNDVQSVSGKSSAGGFLFKSASASGLEIGNIEANNYNGENTPTVWYPVEITLAAPGTSLTQTAGTLIEGSDIGILHSTASATTKQMANAAAQGSSPEATLGNLKAGTLTFNGWALVRLTGNTLFDSIQFPGGAIQTAGGSLNPGGTDRVLNSAAINVGSMQIDPATELLVDFDGASHDKLVFPATASVSFGSGANIVINEINPIPDGTYHVALLEPSTSLASRTIGSTPPPPPPPPSPPPAPAPDPAPAAENLVQTFLALYEQALEEQSTAAPGATTWIQSPVERRREQSGDVVGETTGGEVCN